MCLNARRHLLSSSRLDIDNDHRRAGLGQPLRNPRPQRTAATGDKGNLIGE